ERMLRCSHRLPDLDVRVLVRELARLSVGLVERIVDRVERDVPRHVRVLGFVAAKAREEGLAELVVTLGVRRSGEVERLAVTPVLGGKKLELGDRGAAGAEHEVERRAPELTVAVRLTALGDDVRLPVKGLTRRIPAVELLLDRHPDEHGG